MKRRIVLIRHGETDWNASSRLQGQTDIGLSERGRRQAEAIAPLVRDLEPNHAIVSDLTRTRDTAAILALRGWVVEPRWREAKLGDWEGRTKEEIGIANYKAWHDGQADPPGGESRIDLRQRIGAAIDALPPFGTVVVVTHGGVIRAAVAILIGLGADRIIPVAPASITIFEGDPDMRLKVFNLTGRI